MTEEVNISGLNETSPNEQKAAVLLDANEKLRGSLGQLLVGTGIGISISDSQELAALGFGQAHQQDASVEFARYLLANGASIHYGGDLRQEGYTDLFYGLANYYGSAGQAHPLVHSYLAWPIYLDLDTETQAKLKRRVAFYRIAPPDDLTLSIHERLPPTTAANRYIWARSLTRMREQMNQAVQARIFIGGSETRYVGAQPGLLEEGMLALQADKPTYLIGAFGGITRRLIESLQDTGAAQISNLPVKFDDLGRETLAYYNGHPPNAVPLDFAAIQRFLNGYGLARLAQNNCLSQAENERLFVTPHLMEMINLVLTGLARLKRREA